MKLFLSVLLSLSYPLMLCAQLTEHFNDGNFTKHPTWTGDTACFKIIDGKLNSHFTASSGGPTVHFSLATPSKRVTETTWEFWVKTPTTSKNNFIRIFLCSQREIPRKESIDSGYFIEIGNTADEVVLKKKDQLATHLLIQGRQGITENAEMKIKVVCTKDHEWRLFTDLSGHGKRYQLEGTATDSSISQSNYFSIEIFQKGKTANHRHWFDDILVQQYIPDTQPPILQKIAVKDEHQLFLSFSEALSKNVLDSGHFLFHHHPPEKVTFLPNSASKVLLYFSDSLSQKKDYSLQINSLSDLSGNTLDTLLHIRFQIPAQGDLLISEIYPDPKNSNGLPEAEFIEIYNNSVTNVYLGNWKICDKVRCASFPPTILEKGETLIVCDEKDANPFHSYGKTIGLPHFPSLNNGKETLYLKNSEGVIIYQIHYTKKTYHNKTKSKGGWSLEMQFPHHPCLIEGNWAASDAPQGGNPGKLPERTISVPDVHITSLKVSDPLHLFLQLNIVADPAALQQASFHLNQETITQIAADSRFNGLYKITLKHPLQKNQIYTFQISKLQSCDINSKQEIKTTFALPEDPKKGDLLFNEILFHPLKRGGEFIELYNTSDKIIDLSTLHLANKRHDTWYQQYPVTEDPYYLLAGEYVAITKDKAHLLQQYIPKYPDQVVEVSQLPSYPNTSGNAYLLTSSGKVLDHFSYTEKEQSSFIHNKKGVSLEKTYPMLSSTSKDHWVSASSDYYFATPGYRNSQYSLPGSHKIHLKIHPKTFSPDFDGRKEHTYFIYRLSSGYSAKINIFNAEGILVRHLRRNISLATHGKIPWNGKDDHGKVLPTGIYIFYIALYHPSGESVVKKIPVVLVKEQ